MFVFSFFYIIKLQEAFETGLLKPGMNVTLEEPKRAMNNVVSSLRS